MLLKDFLCSIPVHFAELLHALPATLRGFSASVAHDTGRGAQSKQKIADDLVARTTNELFTSGFVVPRLSVEHPGIRLVMNGYSRVQREVEQHRQ